jgi:hypothetical protein
MWIHRDIRARLQRLAAERPVVVLTGARQAGKTSLLRRQFPAHRFATLDLPADAALAEEAPAEFFARWPAPVIVDEVQYAPGLFRHLKADVDAHRHDKGRFLLTGSQKLTLLERVSESLAGRAAVLELETLSWREIHAAHADVRIDDVLLRGGFPELWADRSLDAAEYYRSYLATYLERDVRSLVNVGSLRDFERFVRACALRSAQLLNKAELGRDVGVSGPTANAWLSALIASNQVFLLEPWFSNRTRSLVKTPKLYWGDVGMLVWLLGIRSAEELARSPYAGAVWETFVFAELRKRRAATGDVGTLAFYRDRDKEADFLVHRGGRFELMDAKWSASPTARDAEALAVVAERLGGGRVSARRLLCRAPVGYPVGGATAIGPGAPWFDGDAVSPASGDT